MAVMLRALASLAALPVLTFGGLTMPHAVAATAPMPYGAEAHQSWHQTFADEFNGPYVDESKWTPGWFGTGITDGVGGSPMCNDDANAWTGNGDLYLQVSHRDVVCNGGKTEPWAGSLVSSNGHYQFLYGYAEARVFMPTSGWATFWLDGQTWPADGEIDVAESDHGTVQPNTHYADAAGNPAQSGPFSVAGSWSGGWHTFAVDWAKGKLTFFWDGKAVKTVTGNAVPSSPEYLILANGPSSDGGVDGARMLVDYVRVWQH